MRSVNGRLRLAAAALGCGCLVLAALVSPSPPARAEVRLPHVFGDNMVLQRGKVVKIWGWAAKGEKVTVSFAGRTKTAVAGDDGKWLLRLDPLDADTPPGRLTAKGALNTITLENVAVGEVWLCSGQSNMEMHVCHAKDGDLELLAADRPGIRVLTIPQRSLPTPQEDFPIEVSGWQPEQKGRWLPADPGVVGKFPAVAYFFARRLHEVLKVPVGIIDNSWGGTTVETWISRGALERIPAAAELLKHWDGRIASWSAEEDRKKQLDQWHEQVEKAKAEGKEPPSEPQPRRSPQFERNNPAGCYNASIAPITDFAIRGAVFYQGINNIFPQRTNQYAKTYPALIADWRRAWGEALLPICIVQICTWGRPASQMPMEETLLSPAAHIRETHLKTHLSAPNTGLVVTFDIGDHNMHSQNKAEIGRRIARWALARQYGRGIAYSGPLYESMKKEGSRIIVHFRKAGGPVGRERRLRTRSYPERGSLKGFVIAGADRKFYPAQARCVEDTVEVWSDRVKDPAAVRYAWATWPEGNLVWNLGNLPASPFRTDDWPLLEDAPLDGKSKAYQEWRARRVRRLNEARRQALRRNAEEAGKLLEEYRKAREKAAAKRRITNVE